MERFGKEITVSLIAGLAVAAIWSILGIVTTHSGWSWPDFFGRSVAIGVPVAFWKVLGIAKIFLILAILVGIGLFVGLLVSVGMLVMAPLGM
jgi:hypothetical protein